jgi:serine/threonine protein kinase
LGSRPYVAPEVVAERRATPRSDIYGVGRALFALATATRPRQKWRAPDLRRLMQDAGLDPREVSLIERLAATRPEDRPESLAETLAELDGILRDTKGEADAAA